MRGIGFLTAAVACCNIVNTILEITFIYAFDTTENNIGDAGATALAACLEKNSTLGTLALWSGCQCYHAVDMLLQCAVVIICRYHRVPVPLYVGLLVCLLWTI